MTKNQVVKKRQTRSRELTRKRLIDAAQVEFAERGFHGASIGDITKRAGVSVAMVNHHFKNKKGIYRASVKEFGEARLKHLDKFLVTSTTAEEFEVRLEILVSELLELHVEHAAAVSIILRDIHIAENLGTEAEESLFAFTAKLTSFFETGQDAGFLRADVKPVTVASTIYLSLSALLQVDAHRARVSGQSLHDPAQRQVIVRELLDLVLRGARP